MKFHTKTEIKTENWARMNNLTRTIFHKMQGDEVHILCLNLQSFTSSAGNQSFNTGSCSQYVSDTLAFSVMVSGQIGDAC